MGLFSALAPVVGGLIGNKMTNSANKDAAQDANAFTTYMMSNRHQMEVADLRAAGLNPMLSAGAAPSMGGSAKADVESIGKSANESISTGLQAAALKAQIDNMKADTQLKKDQSGKVLNEWGLITNQRDLIKSQTAGVDADNVLKALDASIYGSTAGKLLRGVEKGAGAASSAAGAASSFRGLNISKSNPGFQLPTKTVTRH